MTCGYICPQCEGSGFTAEGNACDWCQPEPTADKPVVEIQAEDWIKQVHEGPCCADE